MPRSILLTVIIAILALTLGIWLTAGHRPSAAPADVMAQFSAASRQVVQTAGAAVVRIAPRGDIYHGDIEDSPTTKLADGARRQGSGVIVAARGYVLTNYHVVAGHRQAEVDWNGRQFTGKVTGFDTVTDLALVKIDASDLPTITWGDSDQVQVGDLVWAIGNPFGLRQSVTLGIVSATNQETEVTTAGLSGFIQTDAALNPGSSGGPIVNARGRVVGINTAIVGADFQGVSFATPSNTAREILADLMKSGYVRRGWLGAQLTDARPSDNGQGGARITTITGRSDLPSPAQAAGMRVGDIVVSWNGQPVGDALQLGHVVARTPIGSIAHVAIVRERQRMQVEVVVGERPPPGRNHASTP